MVCLLQALCTALDEEFLSLFELEKEQEAALDFAMLQEKSYLQEIEREQSTEIQVDTEPETEHEDHSGAVRIMGSIHRHCSMIYLKIFLKAVGGQKLRYDEIILGHTLSEFI